MKNIGIAFIFMLTIHCVTAQNEGLRLKDCGIDTARWIIGTEVSGVYFKTTEYLSDTIYSFFRNKLTPYLLYRVNRNMSIGLLAEYDYLNSSFYTRNNLYGFGVLFRLDVPIPTIKFKDVNLDELFGIYIGSEYRKTNYYIQDDFIPNGFVSKEIVYNQLIVDVIKFEIGAKLNYLKVFNLCWLSRLSTAFAYRPEWYIGKNLYHNFIWRIEYRF